MQREKVIRTFPSFLDESIKLVEVFDTQNDFTVRVLGEPDIAFPSEQEALSYAAAKVREF